MYSVYVISNPKGILYKGSTSHLEQRMGEHQDGLSPWTKGKGPWTLVYHEEFKTRSDATKREKFLKSGKGREFLKNLLSGCSSVG
ncbi:GIY-YIG nuclease family protein [Candidatus Gracilibacteria bacterium]|nr:GIY-YIG nuclease family protein [Candidatus Gracilibacteria bacterium]